MEEGGTAFDRGKQLFTQGNAQEAIAYLKQAVQEDPSSSVAQEYLGAALASIGDQEGCVTAFQAALRLDPENARYDYNLGKAYETWGHKSLAIDSYRKAIAIDPTNEKARTALEALGGETALREQDASDEDLGDELSNVSSTGLDELEARAQSGGSYVQDGADRTAQAAPVVPPAAADAPEVPAVEKAVEAQAVTDSFATDGTPSQAVPPPPAASPGERPPVRQAAQQVPSYTEIAAPACPLTEPGGTRASSRKAVLGLGAIAVVAILVIGFFVIFQRGDSPIKAVTQFVQAQKQLDMDSLSKVVTAGSQPMVDQMRAQRADPRLKALMENVTYEIGKPSISGDSATVPLKLAMNRLGVSVAVEQAVYCVKQNGVWKVDWIKTEQEQEKKVRGGLGEPPAVR